MRPGLFLLAVLLAGLPRSGAAEADGPVSLVLTYRARPETRVAFRTWLETEGGAQFARWRAEGVFAGVRILFATLAASAPVDAVVILDFARYTDSSRWQKIERQHPGGLSPAALQLAVPAGAHFADALSRGAAAGRVPTQSVWLLAFYEVLADQGRYRDYARNYIEPQMRGWVEAGALTGFTLLANQTPLHQPWDALLLLEYADLAALARRDQVKQAVRARLAATDPAWAEWSRDKGAVRKELSLFLADAIPLSAAP
jgi:hypothetical protein